MAIHSKIYWLVGNGSTPILKSSRWRPTDGTSRNCIVLTSGMVLRTCTGLEREIRVDARGDVFEYRKWKTRTGRMSKRRKWCLIGAGMSYSKVFCAHSSKKYSLIA